MKFLQGNKFCYRRVLQVLSAIASGLLFAFTPVLFAFAMTTQNTALVRMVHASPDAGNVDIYVDGTKLLNNFAFGGITDYVPIAAGYHTVQITPAGQNRSAAVITRGVVVDAGRVYTAVATGTTASGFGLTAFVDNNRIANRNMAKLRVYHLSPDAGPVVIAAGRRRLVSGLAYQNASDYLVVPASTYNLTVTATSTNARVPLSAMLRSNRVYSVFAVGSLRGRPGFAFKIATTAAASGMRSYPSIQPAAPSQP